MKDTEQKIKQRIADELTQDIIELSKQKFSSNVVEKVWFFNYLLLTEKVFTIRNIIYKKAVYESLDERWNLDWGCSW